MKNLEYFSIGFRTSNIAEELRRLKNNKEYQPNNMILDIALEELIYCETFHNPIERKEWEKGYAYFGLITKIETPEDKKHYPIRTLVRIRKIKSTIKDIRKRKRIPLESLEKAHKFFSDISDECLSTLQSNTPYEPQYNKLAA